MSRCVFYTIPVSRACKDARTARCKACSAPGAESARFVCDFSKPPRSSGQAQNVYQTRRSESTIFGSPVSLLNCLTVCNDCNSQGSHQADLPSHTKTKSISKEENHRACLLAVLSTFDDVTSEINDRPAFSTLLPEPLDHVRIRDEVHRRLSA